MRTSTSAGLALCLIACGARTDLADDSRGDDFGSDCRVEVLVSDGEISRTSRGPEGIYTIAVDEDAVYYSHDLRIEKMLTGDPSSITTLLQGVEASGLTIDEERIYWRSSDGLAWAMSKSGGPLSSLAAGVSPSSVIAVDGSYAYFVLDAGGVARTTVHGGPVELLAPTAPPKNYGVIGPVVDESSVFWGELGTRRIMKVPKSGGVMTTLAEGAEVELDVTHERAIAVDGTHVYWVIENPTEVSMDGQWREYPRLPLLHRVSKEGGPVEEVSGALLVDGYDVCLDDEFVYWADGYRIGRTTKDMSTTTILADSWTLGETDEFLAPISLALDDEYVYFTSISGAAPLARACR